MSGSATVTSGGRNILTGGDAYQYYFFPVSYPIGLAATNSYWTYFSPFYSLNIAPGAIVSDGNTIIYGGSDGTNSQDMTFAYSLTGDTTPALPSMNVARSYLGYAPDRNGRAYAFGGLDANSNALASAERLDPGATTPVWNYVASMPTPRFNFPAVFNRTNFIYIFGGITDPTTGGETDSVLRYSVSANTWTNLTSMPVAVAGSAATLAPDGKIYVAGGTSGGVPTDTVQVYDPASDTWTISTPLPEPLSLTCLGVDALNRLIVMGGVGFGGFDTADVWRSQPFGVPDSPPVFTQFPATNATYSVAYSSSLNASGNPPPTYSLLSGPTGMQVDAFTGAITWTPQGLSQIGTIPVTLLASNYSGATNWSFIINVPKPPPLVPTNLTVVAVTENSVTLSWSAEDAIYGSLTYGVFLKHVIHDPKGSGSTVYYTQLASTTQTNIQIGGLAAGLSQSYYVQASGPGGASPYSAIGASTLPAPTPTNFRVTALTSTSISLAWDAPVGGFPVVSYQILGWYNGIAAQYPLGVPGIPTTSLTINGLAPGTAMLWGVSALDNAGNVSSYVYLPSLVINPALQHARLGAAPSLSSGGFTFGVQMAMPQTTYVQATIQLGDPSSWVTIATNPPGATSFNFTDPNSTLYPTRFYRVVTP